MFFKRRLKVPCYQVIWKVDVHYNKIIKEEFEANEVCEFDRRKIDVVDCVLKQLPGGANIKQFAYSAYIFAKSRREAKEKAKKLFCVEDFEKSYKRRSKKGVWDI